MSTTQAPAPTIRNAGFKPKVPHKLFVNIRVTDLQRSIEFFEALGFTFNLQFTDATATCMLVGEDAYFMLLTREPQQDLLIRAMRAGMREVLQLPLVHRAFHEAMDRIEIEADDDASPDDIAAPLEGPDDAAAE